MSRAQAGTVRIIPGDGITLINETVKEHRHPMTGEVTFRELVGFEIVERQPGAMQGQRVTWLCEADK